MKYYMAVASADTYYNMEETWKRAKWKKVVRKGHRLYYLHEMTVTGKW